MEGKERKRQVDVWKMEGEVEKHMYGRGGEWMEVVDKEREGVEEWLVMEGTENVLKMVDNGRDGKWKSG